MRHSGSAVHHLASGEQPIRLAIVVSHPIQYFAHFYRCLSAERRLCLRVIFCSDIGVRSYYDKDMGTTIAWSSDLLSGYDHVFLPEAPHIHDTRFFSINNRSIGTALRSFSPDVVLVHGYAQITMLRAMLWCRASGVPTMMISDSELIRDRPWYLQVAKKVILPILLAQHSAFLTVGSHNETYLMHYGARKHEMFRCPFSVDEPTMLPARENRTQTKKKFCIENSIPTDSVMYLFVGKFIDYKRAGDIIDAIAHIKQSLENNLRLCAVFAGDGLLKSYIINKAKQLGIRACFLGFVNMDLLPFVYAAADVLVHPSEMEAYSNAVVDAAFVGLPLIVSDRVGAVGPTDTARPGENAIVYPCGDIEALAAAMRRLAEDSELRRRMGEESLRISAELDVRRSVRGVLDAVSFATGRSLSSN